MKMTYSYYKWTSDVRQCMFEELLRRCGRYKGWLSVSQPGHRGTGGDYDVLLAEVAEILQEKFPDNGSTAYGPYEIMNVKQQVNYALQQGIRARGYKFNSKTQQGMVDNCLNNLEAALASGFMTLEDIHSEYYPFLCKNVDPLKTPVLNASKKVFGSKKAPQKDITEYSAGLQEYLKYERGTNEWDWSQVNKIISRIDRILGLGKKSGYNNTQIKAFQMMRDILDDFRTGRREIEYICPENVQNFHQIRKEEFVEENLRSIRETVPERGLDAPCLGRWVDIIERTVLGDNGNHRWKECLGLIELGALPRDFKMPFMLLTEEERELTAGVFEDIKDMSNIKTPQAGTERADVYDRTLKLIKKKAWQPSLKNVDLSKNTLTGKKHKQVVQLREQALSRHGGGELTDLKITQIVYDVIRDLNIVESASESKIAYVDPAVMKEELTKHVGINLLPERKNTFVHSGDGPFAGLFGNFGKEWTIGVIDKHSGTQENTYFLDSPMTAMANGQSLLQILRDTTHKGSLENIWTTLNKKFGFYRSKCLKVRATLHEEAKLPLPTMVAVPNFITEDTTFTMGEKTLRLKASPGQFILIGRAELEEWVLGDDDEIPVKWAFTLQDEEQA